MAVNLDSILRLPLWQRIVILIVFIVALSAIFYLYIYGPKIEELKALDARLEDAERRLQESKKITADLERFKREVAELNRSFDKVLTQLPNEKEIPDLLTEISDIGRKTGLDFILFKPLKQIPKGFYAEVPVSIEVTGTYHNLAVFFERIMNMPRIVNVSNLRIGGAKDKEGKIILKSGFTITAYQFLPQGSNVKKKKKR